MKEFNCLPKMKSDINCYKEGGSVYKSRHSETSESSQDVAQDKKIVKKAFSMHDKQSHEGAKTDLSKLRRGGRAKKEKGTVNMFKDGGMTKVKPTGDKKACAPSAAMKFKDGGMTKVKPTGDKKACAPSKAAVKGKEMPSFAEGGSMTPEMMQQVQDAYQQRASGNAYGNAMTYPDSQDANAGMGGISPAERAILAKLMARKRLGSGAPAAPSPMPPQRPPMPMPMTPPGYADGGAIPMGGMGPAQPSGGMGAAATGVIPQPGMMPAPGAMQPQQQGLISPYRQGF